MIKKPTFWDWFSGPILALALVIMLVIPWGGSGAWAGSGLDHICLIMGLLFALLCGFEVNHLLWKWAHSDD